MKILRSLIVAGLVLVSAGSALGAVTQEEAKKLGTTLTLVGAEKAGNKDGSIPEYTGGITTIPANFKKGSGIRPDPFAGEKPLFSINANNMNQYTDKLTEITKALMKKYPSYRIDVYKTHRTVAFPKYVTDATLVNAVSAQTTSGGLSLRNAKSGIPFPIPKDGFEAMWNHLCRYEGEGLQAKFKSWNVNADGRKTLATDGIVAQEYPYYNKNNPSSDVYLMHMQQALAPPRRAGERSLIIDPLNMGEKGRRAWQYLPGQRRVKLAPDMGFDTPNGTTSGATCYDDTFVFNGSMERFNFKLIGKKEMYIPYNAYKMAYQVKSDDLCLPHFTNPDHIRWELHRVWMVEATLKPDKRHIYSKRIFYLDEDTWTAIASDQYDGRGQLYRGSFAALTYSYDSNSPNLGAVTYYDLVAESFTINGHFADGGYVKYRSPLPAREWTPDILAGGGVR